MASYIARGLIEKECGEHVLPWSAKVHDPSFGTLLYRYFFFDWLFKDAGHGDVFQRAAAWRHNCEQAHWLLTYMRRWLWCGLVFYAFGGCAELLLELPQLSAFFYVPASLTLPVNAVIGAAWLGFKALPRPVGKK
jgi:hypothetical protein